MFAQNMLYCEPHFPPCILMMNPPPPSVHIFQDMTLFTKFVIPPKKTFEYDFKVFYARYSDLFFPFIFLVLETNLEPGLLSKHKDY